MRSPWLHPKQISIADFKRWFPRDVIEDLSRISFCGTHGDPATTADLLDICSYLLDCNGEICIAMNTNGGIRTKELWQSLGRLFVNTKCFVIFSIDGLEDTNHIYRRNVDWNRLMENVLAYRSTGAVARWDYLIFKHNQHQIDAARDLSHRLGFAEFRPKRALGFEIDGALYRLPALGNDGQLQYYIDPPDDTSLRNPITSSGDSFNEYHKNFDPKNIQPYEQEHMVDSPDLDMAVIDCKSLDQLGAEIYVDCHGMVHPCCWVGSAYNSDFNTADRLQVREAINKQRDMLDLGKSGSIRSITDSGVLDSIFTESWEKPSCREGKMSICAATCPRHGSAFDRIRG